MDITNQNIDTVRQQINYKLNYNSPYYATPCAMKKVVTDFDNFPYQRFYRGVYNSSTPTVIERETGWREWNNPCYRELVTPDVKPNTYCWQYPCSTVFPCDKKAYKSASETKPRSINISP
jgi:hypothetical protein